MIGVSVGFETLGIRVGVPLSELVLIDFVCPPILVPGLVDDTLLPMLVLLITSVLEAAEGFTLLLKVALWGEVG